MAGGAETGAAISGAGRSEGFGKPGGRVMAGLSARAGWRMGGSGEGEFGGAQRQREEQFQTGVELGLALDCVVERGSGLG